LILQDTIKYIFKLSLFVMISTLQNALLINSQDKNLTPLLTIQDSSESINYHLIKIGKIFFLLEDSSNVEENLSKAKAFYDAKNYDSAVDYYLKANYLAKKNNNKIQLARSYKQIGKMYWIKGDLAIALKKYKQSLLISQSISDTSLTCVLYNNIGAIYWGLDNHDKALKFYYLSLALRDTLNDIKGKSLTLNNIGMVFSEWDKDNEALQYYKKASIICEDIDYPFGTAYSHFNLGNHYFKTRDFDLATLNYELAISNYMQIANLNGLSICYEKLGQIYETKKEYSLAGSYFKKMLSISDSIDNKRNKASALFNIAHLNFSTNNYNKALYFVKQSNSISENNGYKKHSNKNYMLLADIYKKTGEYQKALDYYIIANQFKDSIFNEEKSKQITQLEILHKTAKKEQENNALKREKEKQLTQSKVDRLTIKNQGILVFAIIIILSIAVFFTIVVYRKNQKLKTANDTLNKLFSIIGHDLRGPLGNFKGLIDLLLLEGESNEPKKINSLLKSMQKSANSNYDLLENLLSWSHSKTGQLSYKPEKLNLSNVVETAFEHNNHSALTKSITLSSEIDSDVYVCADEKMLDTILRNLISNAVKFTPKSGTINITCTKNKQTQINGNETKGSFIEIIVADNGIGISGDVLQKIFDDDIFHSSNGTNNETGTGLGLKLCKEFVGIHNGKIRVESELNTGSKFIFTVPQYVA